MEALQANMGERIILMKIKCCNFSFILMDSSLNQICFSDENSVNLSIGDSLKDKFVDLN